MQIQRGAASSSAWCSLWLFVVALPIDAVLMPPFMHDAPVAIPTIWMLYFFALAFPLRGVVLCCPITFSLSLQLLALIIAIQSRRLGAGWGLDRQLTLMIRIATSFVAIYSALAIWIGASGIRVGFFLWSLSLYFAVRAIRIACQDRYAAMAAEKQGSHPEAPNDTET